MIEIGHPIDLASKIKSIKKTGQKVVLVTGAFDVLHSEHRHFLASAKKVGDYLLVGLESDARVKKLKGPARPVNNITMRLIALDSLGLADLVFPLPESFSSSKSHQHLITTLEPDILAVSQNTPHQKRKKAIIKQVHGKLIVVHPHNPDISTTKILQNS